MLYSYKKGIPKELPETLTIQETLFEDITHDVLTDENSTEETITVTQTLGRNVETVLSPPFTEEQLSKAGYVLAPEKPADTALVKYEWFGTKWEGTPTKVGTFRKREWDSIILRRDTLLEIVDIVTADMTENGDTVSQDWEDYKQSLRDIPQVYKTGESEDYKNVTWPERPDENDDIGEL